MSSWGRFEGIYSILSCTMYANTVELRSFHKFALAFGFIWSSVDTGLVIASLITSSSNGSLSNGSTNSSSNNNINDNELAQWFTVLLVIYQCTALVQCVFLWTECIVRTALLLIYRDTFYAVQSQDDSVRMRQFRTWITSLRVFRIIQLMLGLFHVLLFAEQCIAQASTCFSQTNVFMFIYILLEFIFCACSLLVGMCLCCWVLSDCLTIEPEILAAQAQAQLNNRLLNENITIELLQAGPTDPRYDVVNCAICLSRVDDLDDRSVHVHNYSNAQQQIEQQVETSLELSQSVAVVQIDQADQVEPIEQSQSSINNNNNDEPAIRIPCGHGFHKTCLNTWVYGPPCRHIKCPVCHALCVQEKRNKR